MGKQYTKVSNEMRKELIRLIYDDGHSISKAAELTGIYYPTAKAINKVYKKEKRVQKRHFRYRAKKEDQIDGVVRNKIPIEKVSSTPLDSEKQKRITCGIRFLLKDENLNKLETKKQESECNSNTNLTTDNNSEKSINISTTLIQNGHKEILTSDSRFNYFTSQSDDNGKV
jgi:hypothetical protein